MKKIILSLVLILILIQGVFSQCDNLTRKTPNFTDIKACENGGYPDWYIQQADAQSRAYAIQVYDDATDSYNCHAYAWHVSQSGDEVWINNIITEVNNVNNYWLDGSYVKLASQPSASGAKVFYGSNNYPYYEDDHSAVTTSNSSVFISKMGCGVLCSYYKNSTAYDFSDLSYYEKFKVYDGPRYICSGSNATFTAPDYVNCTFNWTYDTNSLNQVSGQGTKNFTVTPKSSSVAGQGWVQLTLTVNAPVNKTFSTTKYFWINMPHPEDLSYSIYTSGGTPVSYMCANTHYHIYLTNNSGCSLSNYTWSVPSAWSTNYTWSNMISVYTNSTPGGMVEVYATTCCGVYTKVKIGYLGSGYCGGYYAMSFSPNPSTGETTLTIETTSEDVVFDENAEWEVEIFDQMQVLKEQTTKLKGKENKINTAGWKTGIYLVRLKYKDEYLQGKLVVK